MKRFYKNVSVAPLEGGYQILLDDRGLKTVGGAPQIVPSESLAEAMAAEWAAQGDEVDTGSLFLRDLVDFAIDQIGSDHAAHVDQLLAFGETDTLCYQAAPDEPFFQRQQDLWEPVLTRLENRHDIRFELISGIIHRPQPAATLATLRAKLEQQDAFTMAGLLTLASLAASLTIALTALEGGHDPATLYAISNAEEDWQAEQWGWDAEAEDIRQKRLDAFTQAMHYLEMLRS
ncbi:ATP12 family protein [Altericroceibacterium endophyticum]|uniref:Molecular chaperone n=1 Tax=Altericroceibacterium endophyticum TaxID=1808508 RepID=A0A6I4T7T5_9SPHN|nr:molecular chaperone [Altericroceibacterium endophyticum]